MVREPLAPVRLRVALFAAYLWSVRLNASIIVIRILHRVEVRSSSIEGLGLFALDAIPAGERIRQIVVEREITTAFPLREDHGERADHCGYPDGKVVLLGYPDRHVNHSCDPNAYVHYEADSCYLVTRRAIAVGEEVTCDYSINLTGGSTWPCHCKTARCRGMVVGDFFALPAEIQREYRPLLAGWFVRRHLDRISQLPELSA